MGDEGDAARPEARVLLRRPGSAWRIPGRRCRARSRYGSRPSRTRGPTISAMTPPPPSAPSFSVRVHGVFTKRPGALPSQPGRPSASSSTASSAAQISSRKCSNQSRARSFRAGLKVSGGFGSFDAVWSIVLALAARQAAKVNGMAPTARRDFDRDQCSSRSTPRSERLTAGRSAPICPSCGPWTTISPDARNHDQEGRVTARGEATSKGALVVGWARRPGLGSVFGARPLLI